MAGVWADHIVEFPLHKDTDNLGNESELVSLGSLPLRKPSCLPNKEMVLVAILLQPLSVFRKEAKEIPALWHALPRDELRATVIKNRLTWSVTRVLG